MKTLYSWKAALSERRDRLLINPRFQHWAFRVPFTRWVARRRMRALFDLCSGFVYSQVLQACVRLGVFEHVSDSPKSPAFLSRALDMPLDSVRRLLEAAESLDLLELRTHDRYGLGALGASFLGNPSLKLMVEHHGDFYADLSEPLALMKGDLKETQLSRFWGYSRNEKASKLASHQTAAYSELMAASQAMIAEQILQAYSLSRHEKLLDVGGGAGAFAIAAMARNPSLKACVFDLPSVAKLAKQRINGEGLNGQGCVTGGNFLTDLLPQGHDLISLVRILHDHNDDVVLQLLRSIRRSILSKGTLLIAEPMMGTVGAEPVTAAYFGFYLMAMGQGRARSPDELAEMLKACGFGKIKARRTTAPLLVRVITAKPI